MSIITEPGTIFFTMTLMIGGLIFYNLKIKNLQEFARIEHGLTAVPKDANRFKKMGIVAIAVGLSILIGYFVGKWFNLPNVVSIPSSIMIFGGISLLVINQIK